MKKSVLLLLVLLLTLAACGDGKNDVPTTTTSTTVEATTSTTAPRPAADRMHIAYATEKLLDQYDIYHERTLDAQGESILFWAEGDIKDFAFIGVAWEPESDRFSLEETVFSLATVPAGKAVLVKAIIPETMPAYGVSYTDASGGRRCFYIAWSGLDGSVYLREFTP